MDNNLLWQYMIVLLIVVAALVKIVMGIRKAHKKKSYGSCCGCALAGNCKDFSNEKNKTADSRKSAVGNPADNLKSCHAAPPSKKCCGD